MVKSDVRRVGRIASGARPSRRDIGALLSFPYPLERSAERVTQVKMSDESVDGAAVDEDLHGREVRQVDGDGVDDREHGQGFVERPARVARDDVAAEVDICRAVSVKEHGPYGGAGRNGRGEARRRG